MNMHAIIAPKMDHPAFARWDTAMAAFEIATKAYDDFRADVWLPVSDELERISPRPNLCFEIETSNGGVRKHFLPANDLHCWDNHYSPVFQQHGAAIREAWLAYLAAQKELNYDHISKQIDKLCDFTCACESELITLPSPDQNALMWKLERLFGPEVRKDDQYSDSWCAKWINALMSDARRLLPRRESAMSRQSHQMVGRQPAAWGV